MVVRNGYEITKHLFNFVQIYGLQDFAVHFASVDELRNDSVHAFINGKKEEFEEKKTKFKDEIKKEIDYFRKYV